MIKVKIPQIGDPKKPRNCLNCLIPIRGNLKFCSKECRESYKFFKGTPIGKCDNCHDLRFSLYSFADNPEKLCTNCVGKILQIHPSNLGEIRQVATFSSKGRKGA